MLLAALVLSVILVTGCTDAGQSAEEQGSDDYSAPAGEQDSEAPGGDASVPDITGDVVATVNGEEVTSGDVEEVRQSMGRQGRKVSEDEAVEQAINQELLSQAVQDVGINVTTEEAESALESQLTRQNMSLAEYKSLFEARGGSYQDELENVKSQLAIQKYVESEIEDEDFEVTDEEASAFYEQYKQSSPQEVPPYEEIKPQIVSRLEQQKRQEAFSALVEELRSDADINKHE